MNKDKRIPAFYWFPILASCSLGFVFVSVPPVAESYMRIFGVSYAGLSFFMSALFWSHAIIQIPAGLIVDRLGVLYSLYLGLSLQIVPSLLPFLMPDSLALAFWMRFLVGIGSGILFLAVIKVIILLAPPGYAERAQGMQGAAFSFGSMLPYIALPVWGAWGWAAAYLLGVALCMSVLYSIRKLPKDRLRQKTVLDSNARQSPAMILEACIKTFTSKRIIILGCLHGFSFGTINTVASWLPLLLKDLTAGEQTIFWTMGAGGVFFVATLGRVFSGELGFRYTKIHVILVCTLLSVGFLLGLSQSQNPYITLFLGLAVGIICGLTYSSVFILAAKYALPGYVATGVGTMNSLANLINIILILVLGFIREYCNSFSLGLLFMACASFTVCVVALFNRKYFLPQTEQSS